MFLQLQEVRKSFVAPEGTVSEILDVPSFSIDKSEHVALIGSSGSGKTTLLHVIAGIVRADSGRVLICTTGTDVIDLTTLSEAQCDRFRGQSIGYVFQTHHLLPGFSALDNVLLGMSFTGRKPDKAWAQHLLGEVGLTSRMHHVPAKLSVGQQQRVAVARALANRPRLVLADEPTGSLDQTNANQVLGLMCRLCKEAETALLIVTHDRAIANSLARVVDLADINRAGGG